MTIAHFYAVFWLVYPFGLFFLIRKIDNNLLLSAITIAVSLSIVDLPVGRVLGEVPAAGMLILAALSIVYRRPFLAALFVGLSIQIKLVYGLAGIILIFSLFFWIFFENKMNLNTFINYFLKIILIISIPTIFFEVYRFYYLGNIHKYLISMEELREFLVNQNVNTWGTWRNPNLIGLKVIGLFNSMPNYLWLNLCFVFLFF